MPRFAANLTMLFNELPFLERFSAASQAGFTGVEYLFPYEFDKQTLKEKLSQHNLVQVLHNLPAGQWVAGERGIACLRGREDEFRHGVDQAIVYAKTLGCTQLNCLIGLIPKGESKESLKELVVNNLRYAASALKAENIALLIEAINHFDIPHFYVNTTKEANELIADTKSDNLFIQYDIYHMQRMEGELIATMQKNSDKIRHIQLADNPGRNEPGTGEINYPNVWRAIDDMGYTGWIGCEYKPKTTTVEGLSWMYPVR